MDETSTPEELAQDAARQAYNAAVRLLARRDHSIAELTRKLLAREHGQAAITSAIEALIDANYVNDARFAELFAEQRMQQGHGPLSIRSKLVERGVDSPLIEQTIRSLRVDWAEHARSVIAGRFSADEVASTDQRATARIARFMHSRGFSPGDALRALTLLRRDGLYR
jgi:regulatory protein